MSLQDKVQDFIVMVTVGILLLLIFNIVYNQVVPESTYKFGPALYILAIGFILWVVLSFIRKSTQPLTKLQRDDWIILVLAVIVVAGVLFYVPTLVPDIFSSASQELGSIAGVQ